MIASRAPYATRHEDSRGRFHPEPESRRRTCFQRDRDRVVHATAFRRLKHKTQVFIAPHGDHYRTRLTHSLEVAQIGRTIARCLGLDEDLTETLALAHDLGHPPFGHAGESALDEVMAPYGGFDHNEQTLRILVSLEQRYAAFDGLNLTWETLEGVVKHNGPLIGPLANGRNTPASILDYCSDQDLELGTFPGPEAQVAAIADDIAYDNHDIDDGLRAGMLGIDAFESVPRVKTAFVELAADYPNAEPSRIASEVVRRLIGEMVEDVLIESRRRLDRTTPANAAAVRALEEPVIGFSDAMGETDRALKEVLFRHMYRHPTVMAEVEKAQRVIRDLFAHFLAHPEAMPSEWRNQARDGTEARTARVVGDYVAGMSDNYALDCHDDLFKVDARI